MSGEISILDKSPSLKMKQPPMRWREPGAGATGETLGYHRFWIAEHHNTPQLAPRPELLIADPPGRQRVSAWGSQRCRAATLQPV